MSVLSFSFTHNRKGKVKYGKLSALLPKEDTVFIAVTITVEQIQKVVDKDVIYSGHLIGL